MANAKKPSTRRFRKPVISKTPARRGWTTPAQEQALRDAIPGYLSNKSKTLFFGAFYNTWDAKFPLLLQSDEEKAAGVPSADRLKVEHDVSVAFLLCLRGVADNRSFRGSIDGLIIIHVLKAWVNPVEHP